MPVLALSAIALEEIDRRARHMPFTPRKRVSLPIRGRMPSEAEMLQGMGAGAANPYPEGQCTWGVWQLMHDQFGVDLPDFSGNATDWGKDMDQAGYQKFSAPTVNAIAVWSSSKYPPFGHVALVIGLRPDTGQLLRTEGSATSSPAAFEVKEMNFNAWNVFDARLVQPGPDQDGIEGFWLPPGVDTGESSSVNLTSFSTDPWSEFTAGLAQVEEQATSQLQTLAQKVFAGGQIALGLGVMSGGVILSAMALHSPGGTAQAARAAVGRVRGFTARRAVPAAQDAVLGPQPELAGGTVPGRVTAAGRTRILAP